MAAKQDIELALDDVYRIMPKWSITSMFVEVNVNGCIVYTPCDHVPDEYRRAYKDKLTQLFALVT